MIEQVEELGTELDVLRFTDEEALDERKIEATLARAAKNIATDVADVSSSCVRNGRTV